MDRILRDSRINMIGQVATELLLSSLGVLNMEPGRGVASAGESANRLSPRRNIPDSSQDEPDQPVGLPSPSASQSSKPESTPAAEYGEDPAFIRLRSFVTAIQPPPGPGTPIPLLSSWIGTRGEDPEAFVEDYIASKARVPLHFVRQPKKQRSKRSMRTELPSGEVVESRAPSSQPQFSVPIRPGRSQNMVQSQQSTFDLPSSQPLIMTQPVSGPFGTRDIRGKKAKKKRTKGF